MCGGNFGAPPNPPCVVVVLLGEAGGRGVEQLGGERRARPAHGLGAADRLRPRRRPAAAPPRAARATPSDDRVQQPDEVAACGKYVPQKNGLPSGVANTVIGQPPCPVIAWVAVM